MGDRRCLGETCAFVSLLIVLFSVDLTGVKNCAIASSSFALRGPLTTSNKFNDDLRNSTWRAPFFKRRYILKLSPSSPVVVHGILRTPQGSTALRTRQRACRVRSTRPQGRPRVLPASPLVCQRAHLHIKRRRARRPPEPARRIRGQTAQRARAHRPRLLRSVPSTSASALARLTRPTANGRDKVIPLQRLEVNGIESKVQLILESSGAKIKPLKRGRVVESTTESVRGIWSGLHVDTPFLF